MSPVPKCVATGALWQVGPEYDTEAQAGEIRRKLAWAREPAAASDSCLLYVTSTRSWEPRGAGTTTTTTRPALTRSARSSKRCSTSSSPSSTTDARVGLAARSPGAEDPVAPMAGMPIYITPEGYRKVKEELDWLWKVERPKVTSEVEAAAALGDRSENAEYQYGKRRLREIDKRLRFLSKRIENMQIIG